jgi:hypothetical protein
MEKIVVFHVGVGESGTTSLQENLFNPLSKVACIGRPNDDPDLYRNFAYDVCKAEDYELDDFVLPFCDYLFQLGRCITYDSLIAQFEIDQTFGTNIESFWRHKKQFDEPRVPPSTCNFSNLRM